MTPQAKLDELAEVGPVSIHESVYADGSTWYATLGLTITTDEETTYVEYCSKWFPTRDRAIHNLWYAWKEHHCLTSEGGSDD